MGNLELLDKKARVHALVPGREQGIRPLQDESKQLRICHPAGLSNGSEPSGPVFVDLCRDRNEQFWLSRCWRRRGLRTSRRTKLGVIEYVHHRHL